MCNTVSVTVGRETDLLSISCSFKYLYQVCVSLFVSGSCQRCQMQAREEGELLAVFHCNAHVQIDDVMAHFAESGKCDRF